jgi:F-type H+-transporting ATPase subunit a
VVNQLPHGWGTINIGGTTYYWWSAHVGNLILSGLLTMLVIMWAAARIATGPESQGTNRFLTRNPLAHMIEVICNYLRENTVRPLLGDRTDKFIPFLWTAFFFILFNNLLGLVPIADLLHVVDKARGTHALSGLFGSTATQNIFVTAALAIIAAVVINLAGIRELGLGGYVKHLTAGTPAYLWPLMIPIEVVGTVIKPVALALRLFANMTAGHILVAVLFMFAVSGLDLLAKGGLNVVLGPTITVVSVIAAVAIYFLELFVAFLQAFVFMFLTTVFISQLSHHHDHEHDEAHGHEHAHAH